MDLLIYHKAIQRHKNEEIPKPACARTRISTTASPMFLRVQLCHGLATELTCATAAAAAADQ